MAQGEFAHNTHSTGLGINAGYYFPFSRSIPVFLGLEGGWTVKGTNSEHLNQDLEIRAGNTIIDILPIRMDLETRNTIWNGFASLRFVVPFALIKPYIEPKVGFNYLTTGTRLYDRTSFSWLSNSDDGLITQEQQIGSFVFAWGGEAGFLLPLNPKTAIKMGLSYIKGGEADYFDETQINQWNVQFTGSDYNPNNLRSDNFNIQDNSVPHRSETDLLRFHLGVSVNMY